MATRRRRSPEQARREAIDCARALLVEEGPAAITLQAVASRMGVAHGNVTHHFGSAAKLQGELARAMIHDLVEAVEKAFIPLRAGEIGVLEVVDIVYDAFDRGGAGRLVAWLASSGHRDLLRPLCNEVAALATVMEQPADDRAAERSRVGVVIAAVIVPALGTALLGQELATALSFDDGMYRKLTARQLADMRETRLAAQR